VGVKAADGAAGASRQYQEEKQTMTMISTTNGNRLCDSRAAISRGSSRRLITASVNIGRPSLFALLVGAAVLCATTAMTAAIDSADARPSWRGGHDRAFDRGGYKYSGRYYGPYFKGKYYRGYVGYRNYQGGRRAPIFGGHHFQGY
jgi:hypothetical protein